MLPVVMTCCSCWLLLADLKGVAADGTSHVVTIVVSSMHASALSRATRGSGSHAQLLCGHQDPRIQSEEFVGGLLHKYLAACSMQVLRLTLIQKLLAALVGRNHTRRDLSAV